MRHKQTKRLLAIFAIATFFIFPYSSGSPLTAQAAAQRKKPVAKNPVKVVTLRNIEQLKEAFQSDIGKVRLVTILSPT